MASWPGRGSGSRRAPSVKVQSHGESGKIEIALNEEAYNLLKDIADKRRTTVEEVVAEALRLEQLLAGGQLLIKQEGMIKELQAV